MRALIDLGLAEALGRPLVRIGDLAEKENLPLKFLEQIFVQLKDAGYLQSKRGKQGGYFLAKPAAEISFGEVIRLIDGPLAPIPCLSRTAYEPCTCPDQAHCGLHALMAGVDRAVTAVLDRATLEETVKKMLRKIRRNDASLPFVKMVSRRVPKARARAIKNKPRAKTVAGARKKTVVVSRSTKSRLKSAPARKRSR